MDRLVREADVPVLVVRSRARQAFCGDTDVYRATQAALATIPAFFPDVPLTAFRAFQPPLGSLISDQDTYQEGYGKVTREEIEAFVKTNLPAGQLSSVLVERDKPWQLIQAYVRHVGADLVVLGTQGGVHFWNCCWAARPNPFWRAWGAMH